jgi:lipid A 4'-phosphatase
LGGFLAFALLMLMLPSVDLYISGIFYNGQFFLKDQWWQKLLQQGLGYFLGVSFSVVVAIYLCNRLLKTRLCDIDGRKVAYLFLVGIIGAGLIVNVAFKNNVGRARPRDIAEFGGTKHFTPAFVPTHQCRTNCSFSSGDAAGAFFSIALVTALSNRRRYLAIAVGFGVVISLGRISAGAHFFSDTVTSFFVMLIVSDVLFHYVVLDGKRRRERLSVDDTLVAAYATLPVRSDTPASAP